MSLLGAVTYYYLLRSCYQQVIGIDVNFEILVIPALGFTPSLLMNALHVCGLLLDADVLFFRITTFLWPLYFIIFYLGANRVYQRGRQAMEQEIYQGEIHFRSRKQIVNLSSLPLFSYPYCRYPLTRCFKSVSSQGRC